MTKTNSITGYFRQTTMRETNVSHTSCEICKGVENNYYYSHNSNEIVSPLFEKMEPIGVKEGDKKYHAHFLKCPVCGTYYSYDNWQQGIGNIGEFDKIDRFTETENKIIKPILEAKTGIKLTKAVLTGIEFENGVLAEKTQRAFESMINILPFSVIFPVIKRFIAYKKPFGHYWACTCLIGPIRNGTALPTPEVHKAIYKCFKIRIAYKKNKGWQHPNAFIIQQPPKKRNGL
jgi:hypothetical protein